MKNSKLEGVYEESKGRKTRLYTLNSDPGVSVYGERLVKEGGKEYREWNHTRSKLGAAIMKGVTQMGIRPSATVLYLGSGSGTTVSHVSDIITPAYVFAIDFAPRVMRDLVFLAKRRKNIIPIMADANQPATYFNRLVLVDVVFQDIAQRNQVEIFLKNLAFLKKGGFGILAVKSRSVDVTKNPKVIFREVRKELEKHVMIVDYRELEPFEKDHCVFVCKKG